MVGLGRRSFELPYAPGTPPDPVRTGVRRFQEISPFVVRTRLCWPGHVVRLLGTGTILSCSHSRV